VISMGPPQAKEALREALCMGADDAVLITDRAFAGADTLATSNALAGVIRKLDYDIVFAGRQAIDGDTAQVGPEIAEHLNIPQVTYVQDVKVLEDGLLVNRALEDGHEMIKVQTPCLLTAIEELNKPRYMNVGLIFDTKDKEITIWSADDIDVDKSVLGLKGSPTKVKKSMTKEAKGAGELVKEGPKDAAAYVVSKLKEKHYI
ncbi:MAG: electron transfer flavoprotein subunit beta/FixA family protein, partial [Clostridium sp.]|uniref:electron transfer flavoprotein subunit beta/FixA family protein n=1 Tax=Clostridium sp. TaxID=1506 RepID=UPI003EE63AC1